MCGCMCISINLIACLRVLTFTCHHHVPYSVVMVIGDAFVYPFMHAKHGNFDFSLFPSSRQALNMISA